MSIWYKIFLIGTAGGIGALSRYGLTLLLQRLLGLGIPTETLLVNVLGCFGAGLAWAALEQLDALNTDLRVVVLVGFFGAFTTFSTYALESFILLREQQWLGAIVNLLMHNLLGLFALVLGVMLGKALV